MSLRHLRQVVGATFAVTALLVVPGRLETQETQPQQPPGQAGAELVFQREHFEYPSFTRRNPFRPLVGAEDGGPRYEQLNLIGIMYAANPASSVAVVSTGGVAVAEDGTMSAIEGDAYYLKVGESIGNTTIVEIRRDAVIVDVEVFDSVERNTMNFVSRRQGGSS